MLNPATENFVTYPPGGGGHFLCEMACICSHNMGMAFESSAPIKGMVLAKGRVFIKFITIGVGFISVPHKNLFNTIDPIKGMHTFHVPNL